MGSIVGAASVAMTRHAPQRMALVVFLACCLQSVTSPYGMREATSKDRDSRPKKVPRFCASAAAAAVVATVAAAAAWGTTTSLSDSMPSLASAGQPRPSRPIAMRGKPVPLCCAPCDEQWSASSSSSLPGADAGCSSEDEDAEEEYDEPEDEYGDDSLENRAQGQAPRSQAPPKLWTNAQFPEGVRPLAANWDMANLSAAQEWACPCLDRRSCIGAERGLTLIHLYEHRKKFLTTCNNSGGKRDAMRADLAAHYSTTNKSFSRSFVVGPLNDCCSAAAALANGLSFGTFANARADLRAARPVRAKRTARRSAKVSYARSTIDTYIRRLVQVYSQSVVPTCSGLRHSPITQPLHPTPIQQAP